MKNFFWFVFLNFSFIQIDGFAQQSGWEIVPSRTSSSLQSIHFADYNTGYVVGEAGIILKSIDGGLSWQSVSVPSSTTWYDVFVFDQFNVVAVGSGGAILRTSDGGNNWTTLQSGVTDELFSVSFTGNFGICGGGSQTILYSTDSGSSWNIAQTGFFGGGFWGASMLSSQIGFVAGENSIFQPLLGRTTDSGINWDFNAFYLNNNEGRATGVDFTDLNTGYVSASVWDGTGAIAKTTNGGVDWTSTMFNNPLWSVDFPISNSGLIGYSAGDQGTILKTYNAGVNWQQQQSGITLRLNKVFFKDIDFGFAVGDNGIILRTIDGGVPVELTSFAAVVSGKNITLNWTTATETNNRGFEIEKLFDENWAVIGFEEGSGTTTETQSYSFTDKNLETGLYKYRLKQIDFDGSYEYSNIIEAQVTTPGEFKLNQNYPNPFNPSTKIKFTIPSFIANEAKQYPRVTLKVYDVLGNEIATLVNEEKPTGEFEIEFNAASLPSGIYLYKLSSGSFIQTKKMVLLK
jgi:photosystem II stability/assembly factor-like uncharacterized protein